MHQPFLFSKCFGTRPPVPKGRKAEGMITLRELRGMVTINRITGRMISAKELRESNVDIVCKEAINKGTDITVYKNGYVLYRVGNRCTAFFVPEKGSYSYESVDTTASVLDGGFFENEPLYSKLPLS